MKRLLLFLILLLGHAARSKGQTSGPPQDGMRPPDKQPAAATRPKTAYANRR